MEISFILGVAILLLGATIVAWEVLSYQNGRKIFAGEIGDDRAHNQPASVVQERCSSSRPIMKGGALVMIGPLPLMVSSDSRTALQVSLIALGIDDDMAISMAANGGCMKDFPRPLVVCVL